MWYNMCIGFKASKQAIVRALREGDFRHEARDAVAEKNLLAVGDIEAQEVVKPVMRTLSRQYAESPHHADQTVVVHTFRPVIDAERWYIKAYFLEEDRGTATFISVHVAE